MRNFSKAAALGVLLFALLLPAAAASAADYPGGTGVDVGSEDKGENADVGSGGARRGGGATAETGGATVGGGAGAPADTGGAGAPTGTGGTTTAPSGSLPITGGDVVGLTLIGGAAIGMGALFVRRSRRVAATNA